MKKLTVKKLLAIRQQVVLNSIFTNDYINDYISKDDAFNIFEGYISFIDEIAHDNNIIDIWTLDNAETLTQWFYCLECGGCLDNIKCFK